MNENIREGNKKIAIFLGYKFTKFKNWVHVDFDKRKELNIKKPIIYDPLKFHSSWDWQIPAWSKVIKLLNIIQKKTGNDFTYLKLDYSHAIEDNKPENGFIVLVEAIDYYNDKKEGE
jgi:hypothetical protein